MIPFLGLLFNLVSLMQLLVFDVSICKLVYCVFGRPWRFPECIFCRK